MKEYKVLTQKDGLIFGKFDPQKFEAALNTYARAGWQLKTATSTPIAGALNRGDELIIVLEREKPVPAPIEPTLLNPARVDVAQKLEQLGLEYAKEDLAAKQGDQEAAARRDSISVHKKQLIDTATWDNTLTEQEAEAIFAEMAFPAGRKRD